MFNVLDSFKLKNNYEKYTKKIKKSNNPLIVTNIPLFWFNTPFFLENLGN